MTDISTLTTMAVLAGGILYVTMMYCYRKITAGESFNLQKYAQTLGYIALVAVAAYIATAALPDFNAILSQVTSSGIGDTSSIIALATTVGAWLVKNVIGKSATTTTPIATKADVAVVSPVAATPVQVAAVAWSPAPSAEPVTPVLVKTSGQITVGQFQVFVPYADVGIDPSKYAVGSLEWQHACTNVIDAEAGYSAMASATGKPCPANPLEGASLQAASALATYQGIKGKSAQNIAEDVTASAALGSLPAPTSVPKAT